MVSQPDEVFSELLENKISPNLRENGLSQLEVANRRKQGLSNDVPLKSSRPISLILRENLFSLTNNILIGIMFVLIVLGEAGDGLVTGGVVIINVLIGVFQEIRAKRQLDRIALLTRPRVSVLRDGEETAIDPSEVVQGDALVIRPGDQIVVDGRLISNARLEVDESLLTGESDHVTKEYSDVLLSGSYCVSGSGVFLAERVGEASFAFQMTAGAREYKRTLTPLQKQISIIVRLLVILAISLAVLLTLSYAIEDEPFQKSVESAAVVISLVPQGLLLMITVAYALGALRIAQEGALVQQINAVESLSNVDVLCLDKTGTLTTNRIALRKIVPLTSTETEARTALGNLVASMGAINRTAEAIAEACPGRAQEIAVQIPFSSEYKWSGATFTGSNGMSGSYILGAPEILLPHVDGGHLLNSSIQTWAELGLRVLLFCHSETSLCEANDGEVPQIPAQLTPLSWITFTDEVRPDAKEVLDQFAEAGVMIKLISGDNPQTVSALAQIAGISKDVDVVSGLELDEMSEAEFESVAERATVFGRITPDQKQHLVKALRRRGHYVAMIGDGVNDVLSLKQAQMGIAMESGSQATRGVADMVLLNDNFGVLPKAIMEGQRILNGMQDNMRLFLTRTVYAALLIIIAGFIGTEFPFTPKHNAILTTLPVGIPAFILTIWAHPGQPKKNLIQSVTEFVFPAGFSITIVTLVVYLLYLDADLLLQQTVLTSTALGCALLLIVLSEHSIEDWEQGKPVHLTGRRSGLMLAMFVLYVLIFPIPAIREFFDLNTMAWKDLFVVAVAVITWSITVRLLWRYDVLERILLPSDEYEERHA